MGGFTYERKIERQKALKNSAKSIDGSSAINRQLPLLADEIITPQKVQELAGLDSLPEIEWATKVDDEQVKVPIYSLSAVGDYKVWFSNKKEPVWEAWREKSEAEKTEKPSSWPPGAFTDPELSRERNRPYVPSRLPVLADDLMTPQRVQELSGLASLPEVEWATKVDGESSSPEKFPIYNLTWHEAWALKTHCFGQECCKVWFQDEDMPVWRAWTAHRDDDNVVELKGDVVKQKNNIAGEVSGAPVD